MLVRDVMSTDIVAVDRDATLASAAGAMLAADAGSAIVTTDGNPAGIVTETDALAAGYVAEVPFDEIPVRKVASAPLITVQPDATLRAAVERMTTEDVKKLPVVDGTDLVGIVTMTDVVAHFHDVVREAHRLDEQRAGWEGERPFDGDTADRDRRE